VFSFGGVILHITSRQWPTSKAMSQVDPKTRIRTILSEIERRQDYISMMNADDRALIKPLILSCLVDDPELRPTVTEVFEEINILIKKGEELHVGFSMENEVLMWVASKVFEQSKKVWYVCNRSNCIIAKE